MKRIAATAVIVVGCLFQAALWAIALVMLYLQLRVDCVPPDQCGGRGLWMLGTLMVVTLLSGAAWKATGWMARLINPPASPGNPA